MQPAPVSHESSVHTLPSSQFCAPPPTQVPPAHVSFAVQAFPSLQGFALFVLRHPLAGMQESVVQPFPSLQFNAVPA
jgi:hypothetical protein